MKADIFFGLFRQILITIIIDFDYYKVISDSNLLQEMLSSIGG